MKCAVKVEADVLSREPVGVCEIHGAFKPSQEYIDWFHQPSRNALAKLVMPDCPTCVEITREKGLAEERQRNFERFYGQSGIPLRFKQAGFGNFTTDGKDRPHKAKKLICEYSEKFAEHATDGTGMFWSGGVGTGKTHLACALLNHVMREGHSGVYTTVLDASKRIKATYGQNTAESEAEALRSFTAPNLLVLDEVGIGHGSDTELLHLWEIISRRYNQRKPTILISNLDYQNLCEFLGDRIVDRMREGGGQYVSFSWDSWRKGK